MAEEQKKSHVISHIRLRQLVGWVGIALPFGLVGGMWLLSSCNCPVQGSMSQYYYTKVGTYFTGTLCAIALFLITYKGYDKDYIWCRIAAACAFGVAFFPMYLYPVDTTGLNADCLVRTPTNTEALGYFHYIFALGFYVMMGVISYHLFTLSRHAKKNIKGRKKSRNTIYRACGMVIFITAGLMILYFVIDKLFYQGLEHHYVIIILETIGLWAFGLSWLTKGELVLKDKPGEG